MQEDLLSGMEEIVRAELEATFSSFCAGSFLADELSVKLMREMQHTLDKTTTMDNADRMHAVAASTSTLLLTQLTTSTAITDVGAALAAIPEFQSRVTSKAIDLQERLRKEFLSGERGPAPAAPLLGRTKVLYTFIRQNLGVRMHGSENFGFFKNGIGRDEVTIGQNISVIYEVG